MRIMLEVESASQEALKYRLPCFIIQSANSRMNPDILTYNNPSGNSEIAGKLKSANSKTTGVLKLLDMIVGLVRLGIDGCY